MIDDWLGLVRRSGTRCPHQTLIHNPVYTSPKLKQQACGMDLDCVEVGWKREKELVVGAVVLKGIKEEWLWDGGGVSWM